MPGSFEMRRKHSAFMLSGNPVRGLLLYWGRVGGRREERLSESSERQRKVHRSVFLSSLHDSMTNEWNHISPSIIIIFNQTSLSKAQLGLWLSPAQISSMALSYLQGET